MQEKKISHEFLNASLIICKAECVAKSTASRLQLYKWPTDCAALCVSPCVPRAFCTAVHRAGESRVSRPWPSERTTTRAVRSAVEARSNVMDVISLCRL